MTIQTVNPQQEQSLKVHLLSQLDRITRFIKTHSRQFNLNQPDDINQELIRQQVEQQPVVKIATLVDHYAVLITDQTDWTDPDSGLGSFRFEYYLLFDQEFRLSYTTILQPVNQVLD